MSDETVWVGTQNPLEDISSVFDLFARPAWHAKAACRGAGAAVFFPERGEQWTAATEICEGCEVRVECLEYALGVGERYGVWGGVPERRRRKMRSQRRAVRAAEPKDPKSGELTNCGTDGGYYSHRYRSQKPCEACLAAHAEATRTRVGVNKGRTTRRLARRNAGWCSKCADSRHDECNMTDCRCIKCAGTDSAQLPVDHAVKGHLEDDLSPTSEAGVEYGKGGPLGDHLKEAG